jgi:ribosome-associated protein
MDDTLSKITGEMIALLEDMKSEDVVALDLAGVCSWTDIMIIATVTSVNHARGVLRRIRDFISDHKMDLKNNQRLSASEGWTLVDCNSMVINLMNRESREFYELEERWFSAERIYPPVSA